MNSRRVALGALLGATLLVALFTSPLTKGLFLKKQPAGPARPGTGVVGAGASLQAQPPSAPAEAPRLSQEELVAWRQRFAHVWERDPFFTAEEEQALRLSRVVKAAPVASASPSPLPSYTLKVVLISETARVAAMDGQLVSEGEMLGEERVVEIQPDAVVLERAGQRRRVEIAGGAVPLVEISPRSSIKERAR